MCFKLCFSFFICVLFSDFRHHTEEVELLFHVLRCFTYRYIVQFQFVKDFLEKTVAAVSFLIFLITS